jgi:putative peptidoglycan lipid II flippase
VSRASGHSTKLILTTALSLTALTLIVRAMGAVKEIVFARAFGVSAETDAFVLAGTYAMFLPMIIGDAISTVLILSLAHPQASIRAGGLRTVGLWVALAAIACSVTIFASAPVLMPLLFNLTEDRLAHAVHYARLLAPLGAIVLLVWALTALLNSAKQFYVAGIAAIAGPLAILLAIVVLAGQWGVEAAAWGTVIGGAIEVCILASRVFWQRDLLFQRSGEVLSGDGVRMWRSVLVLSFASTIAALTPMVDQFFLSKLGTGAITHFNYASKVNSLLIGVFGTAFGAAIYPYLSDLAARRDVKGLTRLSWRLSAITVPLTVVAAATVYFFSYELVELLFARGKFTADAVVEVAAIQKIFSLQLPFFVAMLIAMRILNAAGAAKIVLGIACTSMICNALFNWMFYERLGASGVALASVLTSVVSVVCSVLLIKPALAGHRA